LHSSLAWSSSSWRSPRRYSISSLLATSRSQRCCRMLMSFLAAFKAPTWFFSTLTREFCAEIFNWNNDSSIRDLRSFISCSVLPFSVELSRNTWKVSDWSPKNLILSSISNSNLPPSSCGAKFEGASNSLLSCNESIVEIWDKSSFLAIIPSLISLLEMNSKVALTNDCKAYDWLVNALILFSKSFFSKVILELQLFSNSFWRFIWSVAKFDKVLYSFVEFNKSCMEISSAFTSFSTWEEFSSVHNLSLVFISFLLSRLEEKDILFNCFSASRAPFEGRGWFFRFAFIICCFLTSFSSICLPVKAASNCFFRLSISFLSFACFLSEESLLSHDSLINLLCFDFILLFSFSACMALFFKVSIWAVMCSFRVFSDANCASNNFVWSCKFIIKEVDLSSFIILVFTFFCNFSFSCWLHCNKDFKWS